jgi:hypothetical protein
MSSNKTIFMTASLGVHVCVVILFFCLTANYPKLYSTMAVSLIDLPAAEASSLPNVLSTETAEPSEKKQIASSPTIASPYVPTSQLDVKPQVVRDIDPELLENFRGVQAQWLNLTLLINDYGDVDQVIVEPFSMTSDLPERLLADLKQRFLEVRFSPGRLQNQAVRSQLRIRVHLD